jgi:hypothetical protein
VIRGLDDNDTTWKHSRIRVQIDRILSFCIGWSFPGSF